MKTILHLIDTTGPGGAETIYADLVRGLPRSGYRSIPLVSGHGWLHDTLQASGANPVIVRSEGRNGLLYLIHLLYTIRRVRPDVIHGHLIGSALYGALAARLSGIPSVCTFHGPADLPAEDRYHAIRFKLIGAAASRVTFVSNALRKWMLDATTLPEDKTAVIYNGVDMSQFSATHRGTIREELGLADDVIILGSLGNLRAPKGYDVLMRAASTLPGHNWHIVIVGDTSGDVYPRVSALCRELGLEGRVSFAGFRQDVGEVLAGFDIFVLPSLTEGFSLATVQAMASGLPVVVTRSGGPEEIVDHEISGVLVPPNDPSSLSDALRRVMADAQLRAQLGTAARERVRTAFSLQAMIDAYSAVYEAL